MIHYTNPYAPPRSNVELLEPDSCELELADRGTRLGANILDGLIAGLPAVALIWGTYLLLGYSLFEPSAEEPSWFMAIPISVCIAGGLYLAINGHLLARHGQTIGKRICSIRIVRQDGSAATLWDSFVKRYLSILLVGQIPYIGGLFGLIDTLFIFREERLCLHDRIAGTMVVKVPRMRQGVMKAPITAAPPHETPKPEELPPPIPAHLEICPYCAELTSGDTNTCRSCGRNPFVVDSLTASRSLTVDELLRKAARLYGHGLRQEALDTHIFATLKFPVSKDAWTGLLSASNADSSMKVEASVQLGKIERMLRGESEI